MAAQLAATDFVVRETHTDVTLDGVATNNDRARPMVVPPTDTRQDDADWATCAVPTPAAGQRNTIAGFSVFKNHLSYLPHRGSVLDKMADELAGM